MGFKALYFLIPNPFSKASSTLFIKPVASSPIFLTTISSGRVKTISHFITEFTASPVWANVGIDESTRISVSNKGFYILEVTAKRIKSLYLFGIMWSEMTNAGRSFLLMPLVVRKGKGTRTISPLLYFAIKVFFVFPNLLQCFLLEKKSGDIDIRFLGCNWNYENFGSVL